MGEGAGATAQGTRRFAERAEGSHGLPSEHFRRGPGDWTVSTLGLGTYLGNADAATDLLVEQAVSIVLTSGRVNVIDTAINYRHQRAERSVGRALRRLLDAGTVARDEVILATKVGYLAPDAEASESPRDWLRREIFDRGVVTPEDLVDGSHAMNPEYVEDQLNRSLANLGVPTVDILYLHNAPDAQIPSVGLATFLARLERAFAACEAARTDGRVGAYGLATWDSLRVPPSERGHFPLEAAVRLARKVGGEDHGFRFVQFPFNVTMPEAAVLATQPVQGQRLPLFAAASRFGLGCFTSVPLLQGRLAKSGPRRSGLSPAQTAIQFARSAPGTLAPLVGQKRPQHLSEDLELASRPPWDEPAFSELAR